MIFDNAYTFASQTSIPEIVAFLKRIDKLYYSSQANDEIISDQDYDIIKDTLKERDPTNVYFKQVGAPITQGKKVDLPYYMGSMDKIKTDSTVLKSFNKSFSGQFVVSDKLDGVSGMVYCDNSNNSNMFLYTRGNGYQGQDVSWLIPQIQKHQKSIGKSCMLSDKVVVRGELIISKDDFEKVKHKGSNARNMVSGIVNSKRPDPEILKYVQFVAYSLIEPQMDVVQQMKWLEKNHWITVHHKIITSPLEFEKFNDILVERKKKSIFEIDGIIINHNKYYPIVSGQNPEHAFAFKATDNDNLANVIVSHIEWNASINGLLKPVIVFNPINLGGVVIRRATGFNAQYVHMNKIGPGSELTITRSGNVIPFIKNVNTPSKSGKPSMPDNYDYSWNKTGIDIVINNHEEDEEVLVKQLINFFTKIKIPGFSTSNINKMFENGYKNVSTIINASLKEFQTVIGNVNGKKIYDSIQDQKNNIDCVTLMDASNMFGVGLGSKKLKSILQAFPDVAKDDYIPKENDLINIDGVSYVTALQFIEGLKKFREFKNKMGLMCKTDNIVKNKKDTHDNSIKEIKENGRNMSNEVVVFTGFRDQELLEKTENLGGKVATSMSKKTTVLVYKHYSDTSVKIKQAQEMNIKLMDAQAYTKYLNNI